MTEEEKMFGKIGCHPICRHDEICTRCGSEKCIKRMMHTRLYGYKCRCGNQEWKKVIPEVIKNNTKKDRESR